MNMQFLPGSDNLTPETDEDDPARKYTFFSRRPLGLSFKCPNLERQSNSGVLEYGFRRGHIEIEDSVQVLQTLVCETFIKLLEGSSNPDTMIQNHLDTTQ